MAPDYANRTMTDVQRDPFFTRAPVHQVVLGVAFEPLAKFKTPHVGLFWSALGGDSQYPGIYEFPYLPSFDDDLRIFVEDPGVELPRVVFSSPDKTVQVAVQRDLLQASWIRQPGQPYPRFEVPREQFMAALGLWQEFVAHRGLGEVALRQGEVSYFNVIPRGEGWEQPADLSEVFRVSMPAERLGRLEDFHYGERMTVPGPNETQARLHVSIFTDTESDREATLNITFRGPIKGDASNAEIVDFLEAGHLAVVRTFVHMTTEGAHRLWGRRPG